jgi:hypothetical protein
MNTEDDVERFAYSEHRKFHFDPDPSHPILRFKEIQTCPYCQSALDSKTWGKEIWNDPLIDWINFEKGTCPRCGWWKVFEEGEAFSTAHNYVPRVLTCGILRSFNVDALQLPNIDEVLGNLDRLYQMHPTDFEKFVAAALAEMYGCHALHTGKSHDGGIDIILLGTPIGEMPVQVKRRTNRTAIESVSVVREFRGSMLLKGYADGIIVSSADHFSHEAERASIPAPSHLAEQSIRLIDCRRLVDILGLLSVARQPTDE